MEAISHNVNVKIKEVSKRNNVNVKDQKSRKTIQQINAIADRLVEKFGSEKDRDFFCKCAWHLTENQIWATVEAATAPGVKSPLRYFARACGNQLKLRGV